MHGNQTIIKGPTETRPYTFDFSYWSHDGFRTREDGYFEAIEGSNYADQRRVFEDLGRDVLAATFEGYNSCLFAYGQTGSGKSYSMLGYPGNPGIIPIICDELFKAMNTNTDPAISYEVSASMVEIYNEKLKDLTTKDQKELRVVLTKDTVNVLGLTPRPVRTYQEISDLMDEGMKNRTIHSTNMNKSSSRAHTVFSITFAKSKKVPGAPEPERIEAKMNLVDLVRVYVPL